METLFTIKPNGSEYVLLHEGKRVAQGSYVECTKIAEDMKPDARIKWDVDYDEDYQLVEASGFAQ